VTPVHEDENVSLLQRAVNIITLDVLDDLRRNPTQFLAGGIESPMPSLVCGAVERVLSRRGASVVRLDVAVAQRMFSADPVVADYYAALESLPWVVMARAVEERFGLGRADRAVRDLASAARLTPYSVVEAVAAVPAGKPFTLIIERADESAGDWFGEVLASLVQLNRGGRFRLVITCRGAAVPDEHLLISVTDAVRATTGDEDGASWRNVDSCSRELAQALTGLPSRAPHLDALLEATNGDLLQLVDVLALRRLVGARGTPDGEDVRRAWGIRLERHLGGSPVEVSRVLHALARCAVDPGGFSAAEFDENYGAAAAAYVLEPLTAAGVLTRDDALYRFQDEGTRRVFSGLLPDDERAEAAKAALERRPVAPSMTFAQALRATTLAALSGDVREVTAIVRASSPAWNLWHVRVLLALWLAENPRSEPGGREVVLRMAQLIETAPSEQFRDGLAQTAISLLVAMGGPLASPETSLRLLESFVVSSIVIDRTLPHDAPGRLPPAGRLPILDGFVSERLRAADDDLATRAALAHAFLLKDIAERRACLLSVTERKCSPIVRLLADHMLAYTAPGAEQADALRDLCIAIADGRYDGASMDDVGELALSDALEALLIAERPGEARALLDRCGVETFRQDQRLTSMVVRLVAAELGISPELALDRVGLRGAFPLETAEQIRGRAIFYGTVASDKGPRMIAHQSAVAAALVARLRAAGKLLSSMPPPPADYANE
jgi:hypothetical protein